MLPLNCTSECRGLRPVAARQKYGPSDLLTEVNYEPYPKKQKQILMVLIFCTFYCVYLISPLLYAMESV